MVSASFEPDGGSSESSKRPDRRFVEREREIAGNARSAEAERFEGHLDRILRRVTPDRKIVLGGRAETAERDQRLDAVKRGSRLNTGDRRPPRGDLRSRRGGTTRLARGCCQALAKAVVSNQCRRSTSS